LNRLRDAGAILTTTESIIFDLMRDAKIPQFRTISGMIKKAKEVPEVHLFDSQNTL
jgi:hypothetical protein